MASGGFAKAEGRWLLLATLLLIGLLLVVYRASMIARAVQGFACGREVMATLRAGAVEAGEETATTRATDEAASHAEQQQVLLTRSQLEEVRRQVAGGMRATYVFLLYHLEQIAKTKRGQEAAQVQAVLAEAEDRIRVTQLDLSNLDHLAGLTAWRDREAAALSQVVQRRLHALQHPANCATAKKLMCQGDRYAGVGSVMHDIVKCFMAAYASGRTMVLHSKAKNRIGTDWEDIFLPLSPTTCRNLTSNMTGWPGASETEAVYYPANRSIRPPPPILPLAVPRDVANRLVKFNDMPGAWWVGQFVKYLLRLQPSMQRKIDTIKKELNYSHPIVAIHVRRTDKRGEAKYQPLERYMKHVENYYLSLDLAFPSAPPTPRRVFLASELPSVVSEARRKYPTYEFLWHPNEAKQVRSRFLSSAFKDFVAELYLLAHADFLVCTFSSNVGRLAFEWMQSLRTDASSRVASVDTTYYYHSMRRRLHLARFPHNPDQSARENGVKDVKVGEQVASSRTMGQDGYRNIYLLRKKGGGWGLLPDYKLQEIVDIVNVTFPEPYPGEVKT